MGTAILRSHDILRNRYTPNPNPNPRVIAGSRCRRRKRDSAAVRRRNSSSPVISPANSPAKGLVMEQVKILKRGEELKLKLFFDDANHDRDDDHDDCDDDDGDKSVMIGLCSTNPLGPDPEIVKKEIRVPEIYAGANLNVSSPPPSDLPFPSALVNRSRAVESDLRKLLKI